MAHCQRKAQPFHVSLSISSYSISHANVLLQIQLSSNKMADQLIRVVELSKRAVRDCFCHAYSVMHNKVTGTDEAVIRTIIYRNNYTFTITIVFIVVIITPVILVILTCTKPHRNLILRLVVHRMNRPTTSSWWVVRHFKTPFPMEFKYFRTRLAKIMI